MRQVTKEEFFSALYADKRDIMPTIISDWDHERGGYTSEWKDRSRNLFGKSFGNGENGEWWLVEGED